jgi:hypothetical protein
MQIQCPHCGNVFESMEQGVHSCPHCGQRVEPGADASGRVAQEPGGEASGEGPTPWERRGELGLLTAYWETWKGVMLSPEAFWARVRPQGSLWEALAFAWIANGVSTLLNLPVQLLQGSGQLSEVLDQAKNIPPEVRESLLSFFGGGGQLGLALGGLLLYPVTFFITAGIVHLFCMLFGVAQNGFNATARTVGYAAAPMLLSWVPCVGMGLFVYVIVLEVWGLARLQRTTYGRAAAAVLTPYGLLLCCCCSSIILAATSLASTFAR